MFERSASIGHNKEATNLMYNSLRTIFFFWVATGLANCVVAQSSYWFQNYQSPELDAPVFDGQGNRLHGSNYVVVLYGGLALNSLVLAQENAAGFPSMTPVPFMWSPNGQNGYFTGGDVIVFSAPSGSLTWLQVRAWDRTLGATYEQVASLDIGGFGESPLFQKAGGYPFGGVPGLPEYLIGLQSFSLLPIVPEPSAAWLLLLGLPLLVWRKRLLK